MSSEGRYIGVVNTVYNVDSTKGTKNRAVVSNNSEKVNTLLSDPLITSEFIVPGAIWSDNIIIQNILSHNDSQNYNENHKLNIGDSNDTLSIGFSNFTLGSGNANANAVFNELNSSIVIGTSTTAILTTNAYNLTTNASIKFDIVTPSFTLNNTSSSAYMMLDETLNSITLGSDTTANMVLTGNSTVIKGDTSLVTRAPLFSVNDSNSSAYINLNETLNSITLGSDTTANMVLTGNSTVIKGDTSLVTRAPLFSVNDSNSSAYMKLDESLNTITIGSTATSILILNSDSTEFKGDTLTLNGNHVKILGDTSVITKSPLYTLNDSNSSAYMNFDEVLNAITLGSETTLSMNVKSVSVDIETDFYSINSSSDKSYFNMTSDGDISLGSLSTVNLDLKSDEMTLDSITSIKAKVPIFTLNENATNGAGIIVNDQTVDSFIEVGFESLKTTRIHGSNIFIGEPGQNVTIYGNITQYSEGSNVTVNTVTDETAAFRVHNTGTATALVVIQDNLIGGDEDLALFITQSNQDRSALRIDGAGRVGVGLMRSSNISAWLHVDRNDTDFTGLNNDMLIVDDTVNDTTPFVIKSDGKVGIATNDPKYKVDICSDGTSFGIHGAGIAIRDILYLKQNNMNKITYGMGALLYDTYSSNICTTGFEMKWDVENINALTDPETYSIRVSGNFHVTKQGSLSAYRRFEILVNPEDNASSTPGEITISEISTQNTSDLQNVGIEIIRSSISSVFINLKWKNNTESKARAYLDLDVFSPEVIGDLIFTTHNLIDNNII